jgi:prepilin-type N-terminal cleavage/methylation domain-containing protein
MKRKKGFTLIELMIVIVIIGVLAAIAAPMMSSNVQRARRSEAVSIMGAIRTAERLYFVDRSTYTNVDAGNWTSTGNLGNYITANDFNGRFFNSAAFSVTDAGTTGFTIFCDVSATANPGDVNAGNADYDLYMNHNGMTTGW